MFGAVPAQASRTNDAHKDIKLYLIQATHDEHEAQNMHVQATSVGPGPGY